MRTLEVRRHTMRRKPGQHLSQDGIELARLVGETSGPFSMVVTSHIPRAIETAIAMGFEVDEISKDMAHIPTDVIADMASWPTPFSTVSHSVKSGGPAADFAALMADTWRGIAKRIPDSTQALIITHGGLVEAGAVAAVPDQSHDEWGGPIGYCEGVRLTFDGRFTSCEILRVPDEYHLVEN